MNSYRDPCHTNLTVAERAVVCALLQGLSYAAIGRLRSVSIHTIRKQASSIYRKLNVASRSELVAREAGCAEP